ncbi:MAG: SDR family oxidoreductase [Porticoccaceae bacterium]
MKNLEGRVAIITGAASGIGRGTAMALARAGVKVVVTDINEEGAAAVACEIGSENQAIAAALDVGKLEDFERARDSAREAFGRIDIIMNNAGVLTSGLPEDLPMEEWLRVLDSNLLSIVRSNSVFLPILMAQGEGHIVNTASFAGLMTYSYDRLPYAAAKAGVVQISEGLAIYLKPKGIGVTCLCPGPVRTNIMGTVRKAFSAGLDIRGPGSQFALMEAETAGELVVSAIRDDIFMLPTHPEVRELLIERATDWDGFLQRQIDFPNIIVPGKK